MKDVTGGFASKTVPLEVVHQQLYDEAIKRRKFEPTDVATMGLEFWDVAATNRFLGFGNFPSIRIPYFGFDGKPTGFVRVRNLAEGGMKYGQPRASGVGVYLTPSVSWSAIARDVSKPVIITEGEFKAWVTQKAVSALPEELKGTAVIGLAGVTSWGSKTGKPLHDDLMRIKWSQRHGDEKEQRDVYIIFDYDGKGQDGEPNPQVAMAERKLFKVLKGFGAKVHVCRVGRFAPDPKFKYAIDDHLDAEGTLHEVLKSVAELPDDLSTRLYEFGTQYGFMPGGKAINLENGFVTTIHNAAEDTAHIYFEVPAPTQANPNKTVSKPLIELSKKWHRKTVILEKGMYPQFQGMQITPDGCYNLFQDWAHQPILGDVTQYLELSAYFFQADPSFEKFYHDWVAHILQKPWLRHYTTIQFISEEEGIGKSFMAETVAKIIGYKGTNAGAVMLGPDQLFSQWTDALAGKVLAVVNEPSSDKSNHTAKLKDLISGDTININKKYGESYSTDNYVNYMFTTNKAFVTQMSKGSRREAIFRPEGIERKKMNDMVIAIKQWLANGGYGKILNWYLNRDISDFNHTKAAPDSDAKRRAQAASMTDIEKAAQAFADWIKVECGGVALCTSSMRTGIVEKLDGLKIGSPQAFHTALATFCEVEQHRFGTGEGKISSGYLYKNKESKVKDSLSFKALYERTRAAIERYC